MVLYSIQIIHFSIISVTRFLFGASNNPRSLLYGLPAPRSWTLVYQTFNCKTAFLGNKSSEESLNQVDYHKSLISAKVNYHYK